MSDGRNKLNNFSLLQSLLGGSSKIEEKTSRIKKVRDRGGNKKNKIKASPSSHVENSSFIRIPQYGHKIDNKIISELEQPNVQFGDELIIKVDIQKERKKEESRLFRWLCIRFSKCFNPIKKRPLKIGISDEIEVIYQNENFIQLDKIVLRNVLNRYVGDTRYHKAVLDLKQRFNLQGKPVENYSLDHIDYSKMRLTEIHEKSEFRARGLTMKDYFKHKEQQQLELDKD